MAFRSFILMAVVIASLGYFATGGAATNQLLSGDTLKIGENISDTNYFLKMQLDCNLVLYQINPAKTVWYTQTNGKGAECVLTLGTDGNLFIRNETQSIVWETKTNGTAGKYVLLLQRDRNLAIYSVPIWSSGTGVVV
ncbi:hypothetical protein KSP40_PGU015714 [Platanthera guangdongensis]|uniref:Bulb-type lectin domain-containing protein n=1 Tax=Platanthera guangdongensis TaxID=2320717 RepID=A0ABR2LUL8_9ASPA